MSFQFFCWDRCEFLNAVILGSDTDLSDAFRCLILCFSVKLFPVIGDLPSTDTFFEEKLVCTDRDNI